MQGVDNSSYSNSARWPAFVALIAGGGLLFALPDALSIGPRYILPLIILVMVIPTMWAHRAGKHDLNQILGYGVTGIETFGLIASVGLLISSLPKPQESPIELLRAAFILWLTNVLVFALWYWRLDAGGPHRRDARKGHRKGAFLFPQMTLAEDDPNFDASWSPEFVDYLFLAFNSSSALSPTDAPVLSRWAKVLMRLQALISLAILAILAGRAVNIL